MVNPAIANIDLERFKVVHAEAVVLAKQAGQAKLDSIGGDRGSCGFAWVNVYEVRKNSKLGKVLQELGYQKDYSGAMNLWNPSGLGCQNIDAKESGAIHYVRHMQLNFPQLTMYSGSRLD